jgi:hypothetical protein
MNPRHSLRKIFGVYEHELNDWLELALRRVSRVIDVGANDGYFTFGCAAAFQRLGRTGTILALEPQSRHAEDLRASVRSQPAGGVKVEIVEAFVGREVDGNCMTLDALEDSFGLDRPRDNTLIKIDVEGAELDVIAGGKSWIRPTNLFLIEVHDPAFREPLMETFRSAGVQLRPVQQRPLPVLGKESREPDNSWLVSEFAP